MIDLSDSLTLHLHYTDEFNVTLKSAWGDNKQGLKGFKPDATVIGIEAALDNWNRERCTTLWCIMCDTPRIISGMTKSASNKTDLHGTKENLEYTKVGKLCRDREWLPDKNGMWRKPSELLLSDLPEEFDAASIRSKEVADKLGMKKPEEAKAADTLSKGNPRKKELLERIANASDDELEKFEKLVPSKIPSVPVLSFRVGLANMHRPQRGTSSVQQGTGEGEQSYSVKNPDRYQNKLDEDAANAVEEHLKNPQFISFSPVRDKADNKESRNFLYKEYQGRCQITGATFPKASINAEGESENYFEACCLLSSINTSYFNDAGNMLCISADTMAKLKHASFEWLEDIHDKIAEFEGSGSRAQKVSIKINLAGEECTITWSQRHFMRLISLYKEA